MSIQRISPPKIDHWTMPPHQPEGNYDDPQRLNHARIAINYFLEPFTIKIALIKGAYYVLTWSYETDGDHDRDWRIATHLRTKDVTEAIQLARELVKEQQQAIGYNQAIIDSGV